MTEPSVAPVVATSRRPGWGPVVAVAAAVVVLDQVTKAWALTALDDRTIDLVGSLRLRLVFNTGSAFSITSGGGPVLALVAIAVVVVLVRAGRHVHGGPARAALGLVLGGAVGNLVDRAFRAGDGFLGGAVIDFVDLQWWPVFNVADVGISVGAVLLAVSVSRQGDRA